MFDILAVILHVALNRAWSRAEGRVSWSGEELPQENVDTGEKTICVIE